MTDGYENGKIYKIECNLTGEIYIGSTRRTMQLRMQDHNKAGNGCLSKQIIERGNYTPSIIQDYPCRNKQELWWRERYYIENMECINTIPPIISDDEKKQREVDKYQNNKERWFTTDQCLKRKIYRDKPENKEKQKEVAQKWYYENVDRIRSAQKEYRATHKEQVAAASVIYRQNNKDKLKIKSQKEWENKKASLEVITCGCGSSYFIRNTKTQECHEKCKKHLKWVADS